VAVDVAAAAHCNKQTNKQTKQNKNTKFEK
jgi:hypothetical protein